MTPTEIRKFKQGTLSICDSIDGLFFQWPTENSAWLKVSGTSYSDTLRLGDGWFIVTDYWHGILKTVTPFRVNYAEEEK